MVLSLGLAQEEFDIEACKEGEENSPLPFQKVIKLIEASVDSFEFFSELLIHMMKVIGLSFENQHQHFFRGDSLAINFRKYFLRLCRQPAVKNLIVEHDGSHDLPPGIEVV
jgi:hypothetical protein